MVTGGGVAVPNTPRPDLTTKPAAAAKDGGAGRPGAPDLFAVPEVVGEQRARGGRARFLGAGHGKEGGKDSGGACGAAVDDLITPMREGFPSVEGEDPGDEAGGDAGPATASLHKFKRNDLFRYFCRNRSLIACRAWRTQRKAKASCTGWWLQPRPPRAKGRGSPLRFCQL